MSYVPFGLVPFPLLPDWKAGIRETLEFRTRILGPTLTGMRQKRRMRIAPRRFFDFNVMPHGDGFRLLDNIRFSQGKSEWLLPIWHDRQSLVSALPSGSMTIPGETAGYDFGGTYALLRHRNLNTVEFEVVEVDSVAADHLVLTSPTTRLWGAGTRLYPLRRAVLDAFPRSTLYTGDKSAMSVRFFVIEPCDWPEFDFSGSMYRDRPVWEFAHNWRQQRSLGFDRDVIAVDSDTSIPTYFDLPGKAFQTLDFDWMVKGRAEASDMRGALYALAGRHKSLWVPSLLEDLKVVDTIGSAMTTITVEKSGYTVFGLQENRRDIRIELRGGAVYYRRLIDSEESGDNEILTIDSALGVEAAAGSVRRVSFMSLAQQASDSAELRHETDASGVTTATMVFEGVVDPPTA